jgi:hypothetical protein
MAEQATTGLVSFTDVTELLGLGSARAFNVAIECIKSEGF